MDLARRFLLPSDRGIMERVIGIGGFFFASTNPDSLNAWYEQHLGVRQVGATYEEGSWWQDQGPTVFGGEPSGGDFGTPGKAWRIKLPGRGSGCHGCPAPLRRGRGDHRSGFSPTVVSRTCMTRKEIRSGSGRTVARTPPGRVCRIIGHAAIQILQASSDLTVRWNTSENIGKSA